MKAQCRKSQFGAFCEQLTVVIMVAIVGVSLVAVVTEIEGHRNPERERTDRSARLARVQLMQTEDRYMNDAFRYLTGGAIIANRRVHHCGLPAEVVAVIKREQRTWERLRENAALPAAESGDERHLAVLLELTRDRNTELRRWIRRHPPVDEACAKFLPEE